MNHELFMVFIPGISWILFSLGGTQISDKVPGWKGWRRFILPIIYGAAVLLVCTWWQALMVTLIAFGAYTLPYGDKTPWKVKWIIGLAFALVSVPIGVSWWNVFTFAGFSILFALSNTKLTASIWTWKICEGFFGLLVGIQLAFGLIRK